MMRAICLFIILVSSGCSFAPSDRFHFSDEPVYTRDGMTWMDVDQNGYADFAIGADRVAYDDNEDGTIDRIYRFDEHADHELPHVILMLDSVPFSVLNERYARGDFAWLKPPVKMIAPFPNLTEICYSEIFNGPPLPALIDTQFDPRHNKYRDDLWPRIRGIEQPWERRTHYHASYAEHGLSFIDPRAWYAAELQRAYDAIERSPDRITCVYFASAASMACRYGRVGIDEVLDGARKLSLRLLYERRGAVRISMMADHGHNMAATKNVSLDQTLEKAGFRVRSTIQSPTDVVISINGLVTTAAIHTLDPEKVAAALVEHPAVELAVYRKGDRTIVQSRAGMAAIDAENGRYSYQPLTADVLGYGIWPTRMMTEKEWLLQTIDHEYPNAPPRLSSAMTRLVVSTPTVILSIRDGYATGKPGYEKWIDMRSTHGGLNQINSATFVMSMTDRLVEPVLPRDVLKQLDPDFDFGVRR